MVRRLAREGARVLAVDMQTDALATLAAEFPDSRVIGHTADVSRSADCEGYVAAAVKHFGGVHLQQREVLHILDALREL